MPVTIAGGAPSAAQKTDFINTFGIPSITAMNAAVVQAEAARDASYTLKGIYNTKAAGLTATPAGQYFSVRQQYGLAIDIYLNTAGVAVFQEAKLFGLGETAALIKATEGATCNAWPSPPDILIDCLDMHAWDGRVLPNSMATVGPSKNIFATGTGDIKTAPGNGAAVVTRRFAIGADGVNMYATRVQWAGINPNADLLQLIIPGYETVPAGTYKCVVALKSNTGKGAQSLQFFESAGGTVSTVAFDETGFIERTFAFVVATTGEYGLALRSLLAGTDFLIDRIRIFEDDGLATPAWTVDNKGHAKRQRSPRGTFKSDGLFIDAAKNGNPSAAATLAPLTSWPELTAVNSIYMLACVSVDDVAQDQSARVVQADTDGVSSATLGIGVTNSSPEGTHSNGSIYSFPATFDYTRINILGEGFHIIGLQVDADTCRKYFDHGKYFDWGSVVYSPHSTRSFEIFTAGFQNFKGKASQVAIWVNKNTNQAFEEAAMTCMDQRLRARGKILGSFRDVLISEGDSRNAWSSPAPDGPGWNHLIAANKYFGAGSPSLKNFNIGWQSSVLGAPGDVEPGPGIVAFAGSTIYSRLTKTLAQIAKMNALGKRIHFTYLNDINDSPTIEAGAAAYSVREKAYLQTIRNALDAGTNGSRLYLFTCTPKHTISSFEPSRAALNTLRRAYPATLVHQIIDIAADAVLGTYSATTAPAGYVDMLHFNGAGAAIVANIAKTAISPHRLN